MDTQSNTQAPRAGIPTLHAEGSSSEDALQPVFSNTYGNMDVEDNDFSTNAQVAGTEFRVFAVYMSEKACPLI